MSPTRAACPAAPRAPRRRARSRRSRTRTAPAGRRRARPRGPRATSTMMPSAPTAAAARDSGSTRRRSPAACEGSTITGRCVCSFSHGDRAEVEREARRGLERADAALAEDHVLVALLEDVVGGLQQLVQRRRQPALEQHGLAELARDLEQRVVLHVARADLDDVGVLGDRFGVLALSSSSVTTGRPVSARASARISSAGHAEALERERRGARLERAAAQHRGAGRPRRPRATASVCSRDSTVHGPAIRQNVSAAADPAAVDVERPSAAWWLSSLRRELVGPRDRHDAVDAGHALQAELARRPPDRRSRRSPSSARRA